MRAAIERIFSQYTRFDIRVLAVRGQRSHLLWTRWSDDDGNETTTFYVNETGDDGRLTYHGRFDEDDFEGAYREFERRYLRGRGRGVRRSGLRGDGMGYRAEPRRLGPGVRRTHDSRRCTSRTGRARLFRIARSAIPPRVSRT